MCVSPVEQSLFRCLLIREMMYTKDVCRLSDAIKTDAVVILWYIFTIFGRILEQYFLHSPIPPINDI